MARSTAVLVDQDADAGHGGGRQDPSRTGVSVQAVPVRQIRILGVPLDLGSLAAVWTWAPPRCASPDLRPGLKRSAIR